MTDLLWTPDSRDDLLAAWCYIVDETKEFSTADSILQLVEQKAKVIAQHPAIGTPRPELGTDVRSFFVQDVNYILYYRASSETVEILRVFHTSQDPVQAIRDSHRSPRSE